MQKELEQSTDYVLDIEEKVYKANKTAIDLLKQLKQSEDQVDQLKQYCMDLK